MANRIDAYECEFCRKVFAGINALDEAEKHEQKLGPPNYIYDIGFTFLSELFWHEGVHELEIVDRTVEKEKHVPFYLLRRVDTRELFKQWSKQYYITKEVEKQSSYEIYIR